ncbi:ceramidase domain-containing protein [candidate division KSB1 bacterium]|nr:ceramidase domain-containing protein [candidate division KSB1 bacterium]
MPDWCFCEAIRPGTIAQPANTWSSLGFVLAGLLVLAANAHDTAAHSPLRGANRMTATRAYANVYGIALLCIGLGSTFYHASLTFAGQFFDVMGMYLFACFILLYNLARVTTLRARKFVVFYVVMNTVLALLLLVLPVLRRYLFAMLVLGALALAYWPSGAARQHGKRGYLTGAFLIIVIGFIIFLLDLTKIFCWPQSWLQGHALWHLSGALAAGLLYQHYRTEQRAPHF